MLEGRDLTDCANHAWLQPFLTALLILISCYQLRLNNLCTVHLRIALIDQLKITCSPRFGFIASFFGAALVIGEITSPNPVLSLKYFFKLLFPVSQFANITGTNSISIIITTTIIHIIIAYTAIQTQCQ